jgi:hypothetical protein
MRTFNLAEELLKPGETALCLFTDGRLLTIGPDGSGSSGNWKLDPNCIVQRVIIFRWSMRDGERSVELFTALLNGMSGPTDEGRYIVHLLDVHLQGTTSQTWEKFVATEKHPVAYVTRVAGNS